MDTRRRWWDVMYGTRRIYGALLQATVATADVENSYTITDRWMIWPILLEFFSNEGFPFDVSGDVVHVTYPKGQSVAYKQTTTSR